MGAGPPNNSMNPTTLRAAGYAERSANIRAAGACVIMEEPKQRQETGVLRG